MTSPFPQTTSKAGHGNIHLTLLPPSTPSFSSLAYTYPLKLLPSTPHTLRSPLSQTCSTPMKSDAAGDGNRAVPSENVSCEEEYSPPQPTNVPLLFLLTYGGGLLAGDQIDVTITLDPSTRLTITTQGSTKIYRPASPAVGHTAFRAPTTRQDLRVKIGKHAALWLAPDPVQPFAESRYAQTQILEVERGGSVGVVDWVSEGRSSRGEKWGFDSWRGRNEIWDLDLGSSPAPPSRPGSAQRTVMATTGTAVSRQQRRRLLVRDAVILEGTDIRGRMDAAGIFGTLLLRGPLFEALGRFFLSEFAAMPRIGGRDWSHRDDGTEEDGDDRRTQLEKWRAQRVEREKRKGLLWTASAVRGVTVVKYSAREVEGARVWLGEMLRQEGTVKRECGDGGLMFVR